jgi:hypothetical protein
MARTLPAEYLAALSAPTRRPEAQVLVYYGPSQTELDITRYVGSLSVSLTEEHRAGSAVLDIANPRGLFDPIGGGDLAGALAEDNRVVVRLGYGGTVETAFTGRVAWGRMRYERGEAEAIELTCFDLGKRFWRQQITSTLYQNEQANAIVADLFTSYGDMDAGDIDLAALDYAIEQVQFVEENLMDARLMCLQPKTYRLYFDHAGRLRSRPATAPETSSWDYDGRQIAWLDYEWTDPTVNKVIVAGRTLGVQENAGPEVRWARCTDYATRLARSSTSWSVPFPSGEVYTANRVVLTDNPFGVVRRIGIYSEDRNGVVVLAKTQPIGASAYVGFDLYGKPTSVATPVVSGGAQDDALIARYGEVIEEIENPLIQTDEDADALAQDVLRVAKWYRYRPRLRVPCNLAHEPGDRISATNPRTGQTHALYVREVCHRYARGAQCATELACLLIQE